jgi:hypothetical protein
VELCLTAFDHHHHINVVITAAAAASCINGFNADNRTLAFGLPATMSCHVYGTVGSSVMVTSQQHTKKLCALIMLIMRCIFVITMM